MGGFVKYILAFMDIGIGRSLTAPPSHTTQHTGPYYAVRLIRQVQLQGNESPSDSKCLSDKAILTHRDGVVPGHSSFEQLPHTGFAVLPIEEKGVNRRKGGQSLNSE